MNNTKSKSGIQLGDLVLCNFDTVAFAHTKLSGLHYGIVLEKSVQTKANTKWIVSVLGTYMFLPEDKETNRWFASQGKPKTKQNKITHKISQSKRIQNVKS